MHRSFAWPLITLASMPSNNPCHAKRYFSASINRRCDGRPEHRGHHSQVRIAERFPVQRQVQPQGCTREGHGRTACPPLQRQGGPAADRHHRGQGQRDGPGRAEGHAGEDRRLPHTKEGEGGAHPQAARPARRCPGQGRHALRSRPVRTAAPGPHPRGRAQRRVRQALRRQVHQPRGGHQPGQDRPGRLRHDPGGPGVAGGQGPRDRHPEREVPILLRPGPRAHPHGQGLCLHLSGRGLAQDEGGEQALPAPRRIGRSDHGEVGEDAGRPLRRGEGGVRGQDRPQPPQPGHPRLRGLQDRDQHAAPPPGQQVLRLSDDELLRGGGTTTSSASPTSSAARTT